MIKSKQVNIVRVDDFDELVQSTYGKIYSFQQQDGCKDRGTEHITVPCPHPYDYENDSLPEIINHYEMGVSFKAWLERDPNQPLKDSHPAEHRRLNLWWSRNFYPNIDMVVNDLYEKGLLPAGSIS